MNPLSAVRLMVKHHPGGLDFFASLLGSSSEVLRKQLAGAQGFKLGVVDACLISEACIAASSEHCHAYANAVAASCGGFVKLPVYEVAGVEALRTDLVAVVKEASDVLTSGTAGIADGHVSDNDYKEITRQLHELMEAAQRMTADLDAAHKAGKLRAVP